MRPFSWSEICDESFLLNFFESILDPVAVIDAEGVFKYVNSAYERELGVIPEKVIGRNIRNIAPESIVLNVLESGCPLFEQPSRILSLNIDIIVSCIPLYKDGILAGAASVFRNITAIKKISEELDRAKSISDYFMEESGSKEFSSIIGMNKCFRNTLSKAMKAAKSDITVLLTGETGTGKDLIAMSIHNASKRKSGPYIGVNCAALPENLLETELFGYEDGAFTGARRGGKPGKFELANGGTIFLDEIGDMNLVLQAKLLRVLQNKEIDRVGSIKSIPVNVRIIAATNQNLLYLIERGIFRWDLFYRLNVFSINVCPLRDRKSDIPLLSTYFLNKFMKKEKKILKLTASAQRSLINYDWPGNIRELQNIMESTVVSCDHTFISASDLPEHLQSMISEHVYPPSSDEEDEMNLSKRISSLERILISKALDRSRGNRSEAIRILGISKRTFYEKLSKYKILMH